ncbi:arrestin domain-containing protein 17-like [Belonocnema kinseyi]|uniref:arrestin domain-containing protein 17-like n=1 Tax=Belonocnema kinseyi TaxID=2817044 RepID=UPI00143DEAB2|nr:arrestin domain-containing protein 17-like [Belonocnema kinseyi]
MGLKEFKISFNNPWKTFKPGDTVKGQLSLVLDTPKKCRGIRVKIKGEARTSWPVYLNNPQHRYTGHEEYMSIRHYFAGSYSGGEVELFPGEYVYPFEFNLPQDIPSSFESDLGHVRYTIKGIIDRPWKFNHETKVAFSVVSPFDLNSDPRASGPVMVEESKTFGCFCTSPPITVNFSLPARGYVSGQSIPIHVYVENVQGIEVQFVRLALEKHITYRVTSPRSETRTKRIIITEVSKVIEDSDIVIYEQSMRVPPLPPSNLNNCGIIDIQYILRLKAFVNGSYNSNLKIAALVIIGTIPLVTSPLTSPSTPSFGPPDYAAAVISSIVAPSYEESLFGAQNLKDEDESEYVMGIKEPFAPRYPVYNFPSN